MASPREACSNRSIAWTWHFITWPHPVLIHARLRTQMSWNTWRAILVAPLVALIGSDTQLDIHLLRNLASWHNLRLKLPSPFQWQLPPILSNILLKESNSFFFGPPNKIWKVKNPKPVKCIPEGCFISGWFIRACGFASKCIYTIACLTKLFAYSLFSDVRDRKSWPWRNPESLGRHVFPGSNKNKLPKIKHLGHPWTASALSTRLWSQHRRQRLKGKKLRTSATIIGYWCGLDRVSKNRVPGKTICFTAWRLVINAKVTQWLLPCRRQQLSPIKHYNPRRFFLSGSSKASSQARSSRAGDMFVGVSDELRTCFKWFHCCHCPLLDFLSNRHIKPVVQPVCWSSQLLAIITLLIILLIILVIILLIILLIILSVTNGCNLMVSWSSVAPHQPALGYTRQTLRAYISNLAKYPQAPGMG